MKSVFEAWLAPAMVFGMIIAGAASNNPFVTASSDDESDPQQEVKVEVKAAVKETTEKALEAVRDVIEVRLPEPPKPPHAVILDKMQVPSLPPHPPLQPVLAQLTREAPHVAHEIALAITDISSNPKTQGLEKKAKELAAKVREAKQSKKVDDETRLKEELRAVTKSHFDLLEGQRKEQMESLANQLAAIKEQLENRSKNADKIIDRRVKQLLGETDDLDWYASVPGSELTHRAHTVIGSLLGNKDAKSVEGMKIIVDGENAAKHVEGSRIDQAAKQLKAATEQSKAAIIELRKKAEDKAQGKVEEQQKALRMELEVKMKHLEDLKRQLEMVEEKVKSINK